MDHQGKSLSSSGLAGIIPRIFSAQESHLPAIESVGDASERAKNASDGASEFPISPYGSDVCFSEKRGTPAILDR
jgi:hypothetical protein